MQLPPNRNRACLNRLLPKKNIDLSGMIVIGDALRDIQSAQAVGANPILVKTGKGQKTLTDNPDLTIPVFENLYDAAKHITSRP